MIKYLKFFLALVFSISVAQFPLTSYAEEEASKEANANEMESICAEAKATSKNRKASAEDREEAKKVYKDCKKEKRKKARSKCVPTGSRLARC